ncbi:MAG: hypothetical protein QOF77_673 [Solirubrobacteraceae bacterium]|nr:hypothetical protein [Solirubrobacteraceae bacterium]
MTAGLGGVLGGQRVCICVGAGGVGKTTSAAAIALHMAAGGRRVALVTIDPARRLAGALGMSELGNEPRRVPARRLAAAGLEVEGELWAMRLDPKQTFDDLIARLAPDERTRDEVLANRIYRELSSAVAGSQEFTAIAKLYELDRDGGFDAIVLDTPPSRNARDFISAPLRLTQFFDGRALRLLLGSTGLASRLVGRGTSAGFAVLRRLTGVDLLGEIRAFLTSLAGMLDGFRQRAVGVAALLRDPATTVVLVSSPEPLPVAEAIAFAGELDRAGIPVGAVIVNRMHALPGPPVDPDRLVAGLSADLGGRLAGLVGENLRDHLVLAGRDRRGLARLVEDLDGPPLVCVPQLVGEVDDLAALVRVATAIFGDEP